MIPAIVPALFAGALLVRRSWLRLPHFMAAGGVSGAIGTYGHVLLTSGTSGVRNAAGLMVLAFFSGVAGGASAWIYLRLSGLLPSRKMP
jgi:hypothetical protein